VKEIPRELARARRLARVLDDYWIDPLLGTLLPGVGDVVGALVGLYVVMVAVRRRVSPVIIARMLLNLGADALFGIVPVLGDVFDFEFKANRRNVELLADRLSTGGRARGRDWALLIGVAGGFCAVLGLVVWGIVKLLSAISVPAL